MGKDDLKQLIAQARLDEAVAQLLEQIKAHSVVSKSDKSVGKLSDILIINSGKLHGLQHDKMLGILDRQNEQVTLAQVHQAVLFVIDELPDEFWNVPLQRPTTKQNSGNDQTELLEAVENLKQVQTDEFEFDLFVSFSSLDREVLQPVVEKLRGYGFRVFISDQNLKNYAGKSFSEIIQNALENSQHFILVCSPNSDQSYWVKIEWETFFNQFHIGDRNNRRIFVLKGNDFNLKFVPLFLRNMQIADNAEQIVNSLVSETKAQQRLKIRNDELRIKERRTREAAEEAEKERIENERQAKYLADKQLNEKQQKAEQDRLEQQKLQEELVLAELQRLAAQKAEEERIEKERHEKFLANKLLKENQEQDRLEQQKLAEEKAEQKRLAAQKAEDERIENDKQAKLLSDKQLKEKEQKAEEDRLEHQKIEEEKAEQARLATQKAEEERIEKEKHARILADKLLKEKQEQDRLELQKLEEEKAKQQRLEAQKAEEERIEAEKQAKRLADKQLKENQQKAEQDRLAQQKLQEEQAEQKRLAAQNASEEPSIPVLKQQPMSAETHRSLQDPAASLITMNPKRKILIYLLSPLLLIALVVSIVYFTPKAPVPIKKPDNQQPENIVVAKIDSLSPQMVLVKGGEFMMGDDNGYSNEKPAHKVVVSDFYIGKYEVTQKEWTDIMGTNPSYFKGCDNCPVEQVSWNDVLVFIQKLNNKTGKTYRLPTEAEWEYAAGGGANNRTKWAGTNIEKDFGVYAWYSVNSGSKTHPIGTKKPNSLGIYDMSGNVWEWCSDWFGSDYYKSSPSNNPKGPSNGSSRVIRGGAWDLHAGSSRVASRYRNTPGDYWDRIGFRFLLALQFTSGPGKAR